MLQLDKFFFLRKSAFRGEMSNCVLQQLNVKQPHRQQQLQKPWWKITLHAAAENR